VGHRGQLQAPAMTIPELLEARGDARSRVERFLGAFAEVRAGEGVRVLLLTANIFLLLVAYYLLKVAREPLILTSGAFGLSGATPKTAAACGQALLPIGVVPGYAWLARKVDRRRLINIVSLGFAGCLFAFYALAGNAAIGLPFYIWLGIFNVTVIAQFWSYANDLYSPDQGKRLFAIVAWGERAGGIGGAALAGLLVPRLGPYPLMLVAAGILVVATALTNHIDAHAERPPPAPPGPPARGGFRLVLKIHYLLLIAGMVF